MIIGSEDDDRVLLVAGPRATGTAGALAQAAGLRVAGPACELPTGIYFSRDERTARPVAPSRPPDSGARAPVPAVLLVVEEGPDAGLVRRLPRGESGLGRGTGRVRLADPSVSRHHATLMVGHDGVHVRSEAGSVVCVDGRPVSTARLDDRRLLSIGQNRLRVLPTRRSQSPEPPAGEHVHVPGARPPGRPWLPLLGAAAPLAAGGLIAWLTGQWFLLAFGAVGVLTGGASAVDVLHRRRRFRQRARAAGLYHARLLCSAYQPPGSWLAALAEPTAQVPESVTRRSGQGGSVQEVPPTRVGALAAPRLGVEAGGEQVWEVPVPALPAMCRPAPGERIGLRGSADSAAGMARAVVLSWCVAAADGLGQVDLGASPWFPALLLACPGVRRAGGAPAGVLARFRPAGGGRPVSLLRSEAPGPRAAPRTAEGADWVVDAEAGSLQHAGRREEFTAQGPCFLATQEAARALLARAARATGHGIPAGPRKDGHPFAVTLGSTPDGTDVSLDLVADGPHVLVAGTTGSGKSELLRVLLSGLSAQLPPAALRLVLLDFKGGSTFDPFAALPHTEAMVTDLQASAAIHVLESLEVELSRREELLRVHRAADLGQLPTHECPARIVVAVDEFRELAERAPAVLERLVHLATVGRSLGLHLVLATQRPQGVVSADIRANVATTLCLRLTSEAESLDLVGTPAAARLSAQQPGACLLRRSGEEAIPLQITSPHGAPGRATALLVGPSTTDVTEVAVPQGGMGSPRRGTEGDASAMIAPAGFRPSGGEPSEHAQSESATNVAAWQRRPDPFIAPELPATLLRISAPRPHARGAGAARVSGPRLSGQRAGTQQDCPQDCPPGSSTGALALGLAASARRLEPLLHRPLSDGVLAVVGTAASMASVARAWWDRLGADAGSAQAHVVLEGLGAAAPDGFPGLICTPADTTTADEALRVMVSGRAPGAEPPVLWVLGPGRWFGDGTDPDGLRREAMVLSWLSTGGAAVLLGDRDLSVSRLLNHASRRVLLPYGVPPETARLWPRIRDDATGPGRGVLIDAEHAEPGALVQLTMADGVRSPHAPASPGGVPSPRVPDTLRPPGTWGPPPSRVGTDDVPHHCLAVTCLDARAVSWEPPGGLGVVIGSAGSGRTAALLRLSATLAGSGGLVRLVPPEGSGENRPAPSVRTPAEHGKHGVHDGTRAGEGPDEVPAESADPNRTSDALPDPDDEPRTWWLVDDIEGRSPGLLAALTQRARAGGRLIVAARAGARLASAVPWWHLVDQDRGVLVLGPTSRAEAEAAGRRLPVDPGAPPGRGWLVPPGGTEAVRVQCVDPVQGASGPETP